MLQKKKKTHDEAKCKENCVVLFFRELYENIQIHPEAPCSLFLAPIPLEKLILTRVSKRERERACKISDSLASLFVLLEHTHRLDLSRT
jgi:hypothetical protein